MENEMVQNKVVQNETEEKTQIDRATFAKEQYGFLKENGIKNRMRLSRIFKASGPGQVRESWALAHCSDWSEDPEGKDLLSCIIAGAKNLRLPRKQVEKVLSVSEFPVPTASSDRCFFRILSGAMEILAPGSYRFNDREMREIKNGLNKRMSTREDGESDE